MLDPSLSAQSSNAASSQEATDKDISILSSASSTENSIRKPAISDSKPKIKPKRFASQPAQKHVRTINKNPVNPPVRERSPVNRDASRSPSARPGYQGKSSPSDPDAMRRRGMTTEKSESSESKKNSQKRAMEILSGPTLHFSASSGEKCTSLSNKQSQVSHFLHRAISLQDSFANNSENLTDLLSAMPLITLTSSFSEIHKSDNVDITEISTSASIASLDGKLFDSEQEDREIHEIFENEDVIHQPIEILQRQDIVHQVLSSNRRLSRVPSEAALRTSSSAFQDCQFLMDSMLKDGKLVDVRHPEYVTVHTKTNPVVAKIKLIQMKICDPDSKVEHTADHQEVYIGSSHKPPLQENSERDLVNLHLQEESRSRQKINLNSLQQTLDKDNFCDSMNAAEPQMKCSLVRCGHGQYKEKMILFDAELLKNNQPELKDLEEIILRAGDKLNVGAICPCDDAELIERVINLKIKVIVTRCGRHIYAKMTEEESETISIKKHLGEDFIKQLTQFCISYIDSLGVPSTRNKVIKIYRKCIIIKLVGTDPSEDVIDEFKPLNMASNIINDFMYALRRTFNTYMLAVTSDGDLEVRVSPLGWDLGLFCTNLDLILDSDFYIFAPNLQSKVEEMILTAKSNAVIAQRKCHNLNMFVRDLQTIMS